MADRIALQLPVTLTCYRPEITEVPAIHPGNIRCRPATSIVSDGYVEAFSVQEKRYAGWYIWIIHCTSMRQEVAPKDIFFVACRVLIYVGGLLAREIEVDTPPLQVRGIHCKLWCRLHAHVLTVACMYFSGWLGYITSSGAGEVVHFGRKRYAFTHCRWTAPNNHFAK